MTRHRLTVLLLFISLSGCSTWDLACGPNAGSGDPAAVLAWQKCRAKTGDKQAQYVLGRRYWEGDGVARDPELAIHWLQKAATAKRTKHSYIYLPPVGSQKYGHVERFDVKGTPGNAEAGKLLAEIRRQQERPIESPENGQ